MALIHHAVKSHLNRVRRQLFSHPVLARIFILLLLVLVPLGLWWLFRSSLTGLYLQVQSVTSQSLPSFRGRTNFLILGVGGGDHSAPDLTDTLIFISLSHSQGSPVLISVPRDIWIPSLRAKINASYHYGLKQGGDSGGLTLAKSSVSEVLGQPVHFAAVWDFATFIKAVDLIGGIDVEVKNSFDDYKYPVPGKETDTCGGDPEVACRYEHIHFDSGPQHMSGDTALKFVRSRNSPDLEEGTDFARSKRQELILSAIKSKLISSQILTHPATYTQLYALLSESIVTDFPTQLSLALLKLGLSSRALPLVTASLTQPDHLVHPPISATYDHQWVLIPKDNNPSTITSFVASLLN